MDYDQLPGVNPGPPMDEWRITSTRGDSVLFNFRRHVADYTAALTLVRQSFCETQVVAARQVHAPHPNEDWIIVEVLFTEEDEGVSRMESIAHGIRLSPNRQNGLGVHDDHDVVYGLPSCTGMRYMALGVTNMELQPPATAYASYNALARAVDQYGRGNLVKHIWLHEQGDMYDGCGTIILKEYSTMSLHSVQQRWIYDHRFPNTCVARIWPVGCFFCCDICRTLDHHDTKDHPLVILHQYPQPSEPSSPSSSASSSFYALSPD
ncbi:hypothetical protein LRAMOSA03822 [Lichtheimia ramosa]|uniref:Uncharacterized protein n=1 Tax=Lichtheimia ramosa TaxID=688394 RepID=A0A077WWI3_9FUNG|nr:hypothetical protein LRAMOSA03822 [Lichtheimia ramosa]